MSLRIKSKKELENHWAKYVTKGKDYVEKWHGIQIRIAEIAIEACKFSWEGDEEWSALQLKYSVNAFAVAIGMNPSTLHHWIKTKECVFDKLDAQAKEEAIERPYSYMAETAKEVDREAPAQHVRSVYRSIVKDKRDPRTVAAKNILTRLRGFAIVTKRQGLSTVPLKTLLEIELELEELWARLETAIEIKNRKRKKSGSTAHVSASLA